MSKFHINPETGNISRCTASTRACKYGGQSGTDNHYDSKEAAQKGFEKMNWGNTLPSVNNKSNLKTPFNERKKALTEDFKKLLPNVEIIENANIETLKKRSGITDFNPRKNEQVVFKLKSDTQLTVDESKQVSKFAKDNNLKIHQLSGKDSRGNYKRDNLVFTAIVERNPQEILNEMTEDLEKSKKRIGEDQPPYTTANFTQKRDKIVEKLKEDFPDVNFIKPNNNNGEFNRVMFKIPENTKGRKLTEEEAKKIAKDNDLKLKRLKSKYYERWGYDVPGNSYEFIATVHKTPEEIVAEKEDKIKEYAEKNDLWNY